MSTVESKAQLNADSDMLSTLCPYRARLEILHVKHCPYVVVTILNGDHSEACRQCKPVLRRSKDVATVVQACVPRDSYEVGGRRILTTGCLLAAGGSKTKADGHSKAVDQDLSSPLDSTGSVAATAADTNLTRQNYAHTITLEWSDSSDDEHEDNVPGQASCGGDDEDSDLAHGKRKHP